MTRIEKQRGRRAIAALGALLAWSLPGCARNSALEPDPQPSSDAATSAPADAAPRERRTVPFWIYAFAHREIVQGADGEFTFGAVTPIDGVETCAVRRRDAFRSFEPSAELTEPICVSSRAGEFVALELPADSDFVLAAAKEGFVKSSFTARTDDRIREPRTWFRDVIHVLLSPGAVDPWLEGSAPAGQAFRRVLFIANMNWAGQPGLGGPGAPRFGLPAAVPGLAPAEGAQFTVETQDGRSVADVTTPRDRPAVLALPAGGYRVRYGHPAANCEPMLFRFGLVYGGLPTEAADVIELPVLDGHDTMVAIECWCAAPAPEQRLVDLATCAFESTAAAAP